MKVIADMDEFEALAKDNKLVIVDCSAEWCGPCKRIEPDFAKLDEETPEVLFLKVDVDEAEDFTEKFSVQAMPTFILFKDGAEVERITGADMGKVTAAVNSLKAMA